LNGSTQIIPGVVGSGTVDTTVTSGTATLVVSNVSDVVFSGTLANTAGTLALTKTAAGKFTLSANNLFTGTTKITDGTLLVNALLPNSGVTVSGTGTLGGNGSLGSAVTVASGGSLAPGNSIGKLTVSNSVTLQSGSFAQMEINRLPLTNDVLRVTGTLNYGGTLAVVNLGGALAAGDSFTLFQAGTISGNFAAYSLPTLNPSLGWSTTNLVNGILSVVQTVNATPTNLTTSVAGSTLTLAWPTDHIGWRLQTQTNDSLTGLGTNWMDVSSSTLTNQMNFQMDSTAGNIFYRMIFP
jgi:autotransporter-associated beta strand protein